MPILAGDAAIYTAIYSGVLGYRIARCPACDGRDCWGAVGGLCNSQRPGVARLETFQTPPSQPDPVPVSQILLFEAPR